MKQAESGSASVLIDIFLMREATFFNSFLSSFALSDELSPDNVLQLLLASTKTEASISNISNDGIITKTSISSNLIRGMLQKAASTEQRITFFSSGIEFNHKGLTTLATELQRFFFPRRFTIGASISNVGARISRHADDADVLIIQIQGRRNWGICNKESLEKSIVDDILSGKQRFITPTDEMLKGEEQIDLAAGDGLFIPALYPHTGTSQPTAKDDGFVISISIIGELLTLATFFKRHLNTSHYLLSKTGIESSNNLIDYDLYKQSPTDKRVEWLIKYFLKNGLIEKK